MRSELNASNLYKAGWDDVSYVVGEEIDLDWVTAVRMKAAVENARIGLVGYSADGFFNLSIAELDGFSRTGVLVNHFEIAELTSFEAPRQRLRSMGPNCAETLTAPALSLNSSRRWLPCALS